MIASINIGSNCGNRRAVLDRAARAIGNALGATVHRAPVIETPAWGYDSANPYLNLGMTVETDLPPGQLHRLLQEIQNHIDPSPHRDAHGNYIDRVIDIDLIAVDDIVIDSPELTLPHPRMRQRRFVLLPMATLLPDWRHPVSGIPIATLLADEWKQRLLDAASPEKIPGLSRFFKTGPGQYGEGDRFIGLTVPLNRAIARDYHSAPLATIKAMLDSPEHEFRLSGLLALVARYRKHKDPDSRRETVDFYLTNAGRANNWDLVDLSCYEILGAHVLETGDTDILDSLSHSDNLWRQRIAIVSTMALIRAGQNDMTLRLASRYLTHPHQLIHKATGWMLREMGKRSPQALTEFLDTHAAAMPRTALRYAIERLSPELRQHYMKIQK